MSGYNGKEIGQLSSYFHDVAGTLYAGSRQTLYITGFSYDGTAPGRVGLVF